MITKNEQLVWEKYKSEFVFDNGIIRVYPAGWENGHPFWKVEKGENCTCHTYHINYEEDIWIMRSLKGTNVAFEQNINPRFPISMVVDKDLQNHYRRLDKLIKYISKPTDKKEFIKLLIIIFNRVKLYLPLEIIFYILSFMREIDFLLFT